MSTPTWRRFAPPGLRSLSLRSVSVTLAATWIVHELRVVAGYGADAGQVLAAPGHEYLPLLAAVALVLLGVAGVRWCADLVHAATGRRPVAHGVDAPGLGYSWVCTASALVAVYLVQAGLESLLDPTHPIVAHGGWTVIPIAMVVGLVVVLVLRGAHRAVEQLARRGAVLHERARTRNTRRALPANATWPRPTALARHLAGRAPPFLA